MNIDTSNMAPDDLVRRWPAECAINFDDEPKPSACGLIARLNDWLNDYRDDGRGQGGFIAVLAVILLSCVAVGSFIAAITN